MQSYYHIFCLMRPKLVIISGQFVFFALSTLFPFLLICRESVIITQLEIGHSGLTHQYLSLREEPPFCYGCNCQLTIKHILIECIDYSEIRSKYYKSKNQRDLLDTIEPKKIIDFIREIGLFKRI